MKPLPAQQSAGRPQGEAMPSLPTVLTTPNTEFSKANRRASTCPVQRAYPWLLSASTAVAALFCLLYITKPVIVPPIAGASSLSLPVTIQPSTPATSPALASSPLNGLPQPGLMPQPDRLPGESAPSQSAAIKPTPADPRTALPGPVTASAFEETNLRIQHILTAEAPGGHMNRIDIDVPVLYQSRNLRWTLAETEEARNLLVRLMDYQEKSQMLRSEGVELLDTWNRLIGNSIPSEELRADSPTLPANQMDAADAPQPAGLITTESIQIQPSEK